jgi:hypothetical protein
VEVQDLTFGSARPRWTGALLGLGLLAGCGNVAGPGAPTGPYATFSPSPPVQVAQQQCAASPAPSPSLLYLANPLLRQQTALQRVSDDLAGSVPGGNIATDTKLVADSADAISTIETSTTATICEPIGAHLVVKVSALVEADHALASAGSTSGDVAAALTRARAAYDALKAFVDSPQ